MIGDVLRRTDVHFDDTPELVEPYVPQPFPPAAWWRSLDGPARAFVVGLAGLALGFALTPWPALAVIVPSFVVTLDAMGLSFDRRPPE